MFKYSIIALSTLSVLAILGLSNPNNVSAATCASFSDTFSGVSLNPVYTGSTSSPVLDNGKMLISAGYGSSYNVISGPGVTMGGAFDAELTISNFVVTGTGKIRVSFFMDDADSNVEVISLLVNGANSSAAYNSIAGANELTSSQIAISIPTPTTIKLKLSRIGKSVKAYYDVNGKGYQYLDEPINSGLVNADLASAKSKLTVQLTDATPGTSISVKVDDWKVTCKPIETDNRPSLPVYRFKHSKNGKYFYTIKASEKTKLQAGTTWKYEKIAFYAYARNSSATCSTGIPLYRFYSAKFASHFFTLSESEKTKLITTDPNWAYEGIAYCAMKQPMVNNVFDAYTRIPVYRLYNSGLRTHMFTTSSSERTTFKNKGWTDEGIKFYTPQPPLG